MISLYKRGRIFWARGTIHGRAIRCSLDTQFKEVAWQRVVDLELREGKPAVKWVEFAEQFRQWKAPHLAISSQGKYRFVGNRFGKYLAKRGFVHLEDITPELLSLYVKDRQEDLHPRSGNAIGPEGIKSDLRILHSIFDYARKCGYLDRNPVIVPGLNTVGGKTLPFSADELRKLLDHPYLNTNPFRLALVSTFLYTGLRISDIAALTKKAVDLKADTILLRTTKRDKDVFLGLHNDLRQAIRTHLTKLNDAQRFSPYMFPTSTGRQSWTQSLDAKLRRIFKASGIEKGHAHRFRDTFAVGLLEQGASLYDVSKLLGITSRVAEEHYSPYVSELRSRATNLVQKLDFGVYRGQNANVL